MSLELAVSFVETLGSYNCYWCLHSDFTSTIFSVQTDECRSRRSCSRVWKQEDKHGQHAGKDIILLEEPFERRIVASHERRRRKSSCHPRISDAFPSAISAYIHCSSVPPRPPCHPTAKMPQQQALRKRKSNGERVRVTRACDRCKRYVLGSCMSVY